MLSKLAGVRRLQRSCRLLASALHTPAPAAFFPEHKAKLLKDEYGSMDDAGETHFIKNFETQSGYTFPELRVRYKTWGKLNEKKDNVLVVCHALTGNANVAGWWGALLGPGKAFDTDKYLVFCANILGSCYGTTGPQDIDPATGAKYGSNFPDVTVRDSAKMQLEAVKHGLGASSIAGVVGGSLGGMQTVEMALCGGDFIRSIVAVACGGRHHAWQIAISEAQREAIVKDPNWAGGNYPPNKKPLNGLSVARQIAMISYRTHHVYEKRFGRQYKERLANQSTGLPYDKKMFEIESYLNYQGDKFLTRFDPLSYWVLTKKMDTHDVADGREGTYEEVLGSLKQPTLILGVDSDILYPNCEQQELADLIPNSKIEIFPSNEGHDGFLLEQEAIGNATIKHLSEHSGI